MHIASPSTLPHINRAAEKMQHAPAEIINEIFKYLILNILLVHNPREFPWYLGQICASWRAKFMSTPWIWRKFIIQVDQIRERNLDNASRLVKLCIQRSRDQPLSLSFLYTQKCSPQKRRQYVNQMLLDLIVQSQRWEIVEMDHDLLSLKAFCLPNLQNHLPLLRSMTLRTDRIRWDKPKFGELFLRAHSLTQVEIACFPAYDFDWSRLTVLTLHYPSSAADILPVMRRLRCIEKLQLGAYLDQADEEQDAMIALPTLKVLSCPGNVLRHLRAPALEELRMRARPPLPLPGGAMLSLRTSSGSITRLILGYRCCIDSDAKWILQELRNVTKLCLEVGLNLSYVLPYDLEKGIQILPNLELLIAGNTYYHRWWHSQSDIEKLYATVSSRISKPGLLEWSSGAGKLKELRTMKQFNDKYLATSRLGLLCEEHKVKYLTSKRLHKAGHTWCSEVESCAFELCNSNSLFGLKTESLVSY